MKKLILFTIVLFAIAKSYSQQVVVAAPSEYDRNIVFTKVEKEAEFPGGLPGWRTYLQKNLNVNLAAEHVPLKRKERAAAQTVYVQFIVDNTGKILDVHAVQLPELKEIHPALIDEAIRVIKHGPDWIPAEQNRRKVNYIVTQPITFRVTK